METPVIKKIMNSYSLKMIIIAFLAILLLIPSVLIQELIHERIALSDGVKKELYAQWGGKQVISGPVLNIPYTIKEPAGKDQVMADRHGVAHFLPETLRTDGSLSPGSRKRGIYEVIVYEGKLKLKGTFVTPDVAQLDLPNAIYHWDAAYFTIGITDMRGIRNLPELMVNGRKYEVYPGVADTHLFNSGITIKAGTMDFSQPVNFEIDLALNGSEDLSVEPLGKTTDVSLRSEWPEPSFTGAFLPATREVSSKGFTASWKVTHLNRNFPQQWADNKFTTSPSKLGVELLIPVDHYQKAMRSAKYAILFIALNFIVFLFIEMKSKNRIHPFQYVLVAFALLIFYALLTSVSEQIGFNPAYLVSAIAVTLLISWYVYGILRSTKLAAWVMLLQTGLYLFLFVILQLQDYALLAGSIGMFVILALIMYGSRQIRWYEEETVRP